MTVINMDRQENRLTGDLMDIFFKVHVALGPGLLESVYEECVCYEMAKRGISFERQKALPIKYEGILISSGLRLDFIIENRIIVELKSIEKLLPVHEAQILSYLKLSDCEIGLLVNFNVPLIKQGVKRFINTADLRASAPPRLNQ